jgi:hypothetical protein
MTSKQVFRQFVRQYAQAIDHMMAVKATHLDLPKNFMDNWLQAQQQYRKDYPKWTLTFSTLWNMVWQPLRVSALWLDSPAIWFRDFIEDKLMYDKDLWDEIGLPIVLLLILVAALYVANG